MACEFPVAVWQSFCELLYTYLLTLAYFFRQKSLTTRCCCCVACSCNSGGRTGRVRWLRESRLRRVGLRRFQVHLPRVGLLDGCNWRLSHACFRHSLPAARLRRRHRELDTFSTCLLNPPTQDSTRLARILLPLHSVSM